MSYASRFELAMDQSFRDRVTACAVEAAVPYSTNANASVAALGLAIITAAENALGLVKLAALTTPAFREVTDPDTITDAQIKTAVDAAWIVYARSLYPPAPPHGPGGGPAVGTLPADPT